MTVPHRDIAGLRAGSLVVLPMLALALTLAPVAHAAGSGAGASTASAADVIAQAGSIALADSDIRALVAGLPASERAAVASSLDSLEQVVHADLVQRMEM